jgi:hypothetical protein
MNDLIACTPGAPGKIGQAQADLSNPFLHEGGHAVFYGLVLEVFYL